MPRTLPSLAPRTFILGRQKALVEPMRTLSTLTLILALHSAAAAFEPTGNAVADTFLRAVEAAGFADARAASVTREAGTTRLLGVAAGGEGGRQVAIKEVAIDAGLVNAANELKADALRYEDVALGSPAAPPFATIGEIHLARVTLSGEKSGAGLPSLLGMFGTLSLQALSAQSATGDDLALGRLALDLGDRVGDRQGGTGSIAVEGFQFAPELLGNDASASLKALGYDTVQLSFEARGSWEAVAGDTTLETAQLAIAGMGRLTLSLDATGLTQSAYQALRTTGADVPSILEALGNVGLSRLTVTINDDGLTERIIATIARENGTTLEGVKSSARAAVAGLLAPLGDTPFAAKAQAAAEAFLASPGRMTLSAAPQETVTALQLVSAAMLNPQTLPTLLAIDVSAP
ncbi:MAG: hypothetical protein AAGJ94_16905 [Pseudomonadota bacterium]